MRRILPFVLLSVCLMLFACARPPKAIEQSNILELIRENSTTKAQVETLLGPPDDVSVADGQNEMWIYRHKKKKVRHTNIPYAIYFYHERNVVTRELAIVFDSKGTVAKRSMREESAMETGGMFGGAADADQRPVKQNDPTPPSMIPGIEPPAKVPDATAPATPEGDPRASDIRKQ